MVLATAQEVSFWQWMPSRRTPRLPQPVAQSPIAAVTRDGSIPPLVSQMTTTSAPASSAVAATWAAYAGS